MYKSHIRRIVFFGILGLVAALAVALLSPKIYESRLEMLLGEGAGGRQAPGTLTPDVQNIVDRGVTQGAQTERQVLSSQSVFYQALARVADARGRPDLKENWIDYYRKYDIEMARTTNQQVDAGVALILVRAYDPVIAADVATEIGNVYNDVKMRQAREGISEGLEYLDNQVKLAAKDLEIAENAYQAFKQSEGVADFQQATRDETVAKTNLNQSIEGLTAQLRATEAELARQRQQLRDLPQEQMEGRVSSVSPQVLAFEQRLAELKTQREVMMGTYLPDSPNVKALDDAIQVINQKLVAERKKGFSDQSKTLRTQTTRQAVQQALAANEAKRDSLAAQIASLRQSYAKQTAIVSTMPAKEVELVKRERDRNIADEQYRLLKRMQQELKNRFGTSGRSAVILNTAQPDEEPIAPQPGKFAIIGLTAGLILGLIISFLIESLNQRVTDPELAYALTGAPVTAMMGRKQTAGNRVGMRALLQGNGKPLDAAKAMAYSALRQGGRRSIVVTPVRSNVRGAGFAVEYATSAARLGQRVLLVDGDLARAPISKVLEAPAESSLAAALSGGAVKPVKLPVPNLSFLPAGNADAGFDEGWLNALQAIAKQFEAEYDLVVWNTPACLDAVDVVYFTSVASDVYVVASAKATRSSDLASAREMLSHAGQFDLQVVLMDASDDQAPVQDVAMRSNKPVLTD